MCTYMKDIEGFKQKDFKGKSFDDIKKMFDKVYKRVNTFVDMNTKNVEESLKKTQEKVTEGSFKRAGQEPEQESAKKQKLTEQEQAKVADDDTAELKRCLEIVSEDDDDAEIEATPLSSKSSTIVVIRSTEKGKKMLQDHQSKWKLTKLSNFWNNVQELQQRRLRSFKEYCQGMV
nr:hypothetical protein [Tanacetum cinerariifolium]